MEKKEIEEAGHELPARLIFESYGNTYTWEVPYSDLYIDEVIEAFYRLLVAQQWVPETVLNGMYNFVLNKAANLEIGLEDEDTNACNKCMCTEIDMDSTSITTDAKHVQYVTDDPFPGSTPYFNFENMSDNTNKTE